jgi:CHAT domain-containing protein/tetratricopeptide (TPR) repeat protein
MIRFGKSIALLVVAACCITPVRSPTQSGGGVVITAVATTSAAASASIRVGDVVSFTVCGQTKRRINSPFDFDSFRVEHDTCSGDPQIQGSRSGKKYTWKLEPGDLGVEVRPPFTERCLTVYRDGEEQAEKLQLAKASTLWREITADATCGPATWLPAWMALHTAKMFASSHRWDEADREYGRAVASARTLSIAADVLAEWGESFLTREEWTKAEECYRRAVAQAERSGEGNLAVAAYLDGLSTIYLKRGDLTKAMEYSSRELAITERLAPDTLGLALTLANNGSIAWRRGDLARAEQYFRRDLEICERHGQNTLDLAASLNNLGSLLLERSDQSGAESYYQKALAITEKLDDRGLNIALCLHNLGVVALQRGDLDVSENYFRRSLSLKEKVAPTSLSVANSLNALGKLERRRGDPAAAKRYLMRAAAIQRRLVPRGLALADTLNSIGDVHYDAGDLELARKYYQEALRIRETIAPETRTHAETLASLARTMERKGSKVAASVLFERALNALEKQTARLGGGEETHAIFRAKYSRYYEEFARLLVARRLVAAAFEISERSRAQTLLETLAAGRVDIRKGVDPHLLERQRALRAVIASKSEERVRLLSTASKSEMVDTVKRDLSDALAQNERLQAEIRASSPNYAALTTPQPLSLSQVQHGLLDDDTVLLEYFLGDNRSFLWAVSSKSIAVHELPDRETIERVARRLYRLLREPGIVVKGETGSQRQMRLETAEAAWPVAAHELGRILLSPVASDIKAKRLLIVSDGALQYIPFSILPTPEGVQEDLSSAVPIGISHELVSLPSASVLAALRQEETLRKTPPKAVAVLADPVFDRRDDRLRPSARLTRNVDAQTISFWSAHRRTASIGEGGVDGSDVTGLPRLLFTRQEAAMIMASTPDKQKVAELDFRANRQTAISSELAKYRIIHFATHGIVDSSHPELSGLVFSLVDENGNPQDGFVGLSDIYNLTLPVDLVVLSACETGLGKEIRREGLVGLTRGFMYAGASSVVASLWTVDDLATSRLMARFYLEMEQHGLRPAAALRAAQMEMRDQTQWRSPYYWAAFQIHGDWR